MKSIGGVRLSIRNSAIDQFGISIFSQTPSDDAILVAARCMSSVLSRAGTQLVLSPLDG